MSFWFPTSLSVVVHFVRTIAETIHMVSSLNLFLSCRIYCTEKSCQVHQLKDHVDFKRFQKMFQKHNTEERRLNWNF